MLLGYECQSLPRDRMGDYDYYCYLEDDLMLHDPWFFIKLGWFARTVGSESLLQPNRFEVGRNLLKHKAYIDGSLPSQATTQYQDLGQFPRIVADIMGVRVVFRRPTNPHSGCYFLDAGQMRLWAGKPYFADRDGTFVGPLESAASLGIMRTFRVYKPVAENASFLEIEHFGTSFIGQLRIERRH